MCTITNGLQKLMCYCLSIKMTSDTQGMYTSSMNAEAVSSMNPRILLIDDDKTIIHLLSRVLNKYQFDVIIAENGTDGVRLAGEQKPEAVILDLMLPKLNGWEICKQIRSFSKVPIIVYSGSSDPETKESILAQGATCFLSKPVPITDLVATVRGVIE